MWHFVEYRTGEDYAFVDGVKVAVKDALDLIMRAEIIKPTSLGIRAVFKRDENE